jgi:hypothetical protein
MAREVLRNALMKEIRAMVSSQWNATAKPIDRWLSLLGIAVGLLLFLVPKNRTTDVIFLVIVFGLLTRPIWNFWWIEHALWRRLLTLAFFAAILMLIGLWSWPKSREAFHAEACNTIYQSGASTQSPFVIAEQTDSAIALFPIDVLTTLHVTNAQSIGTSVLSYGLDSAANRKGPWVPMCPEALDGTDLFLRSVDNDLRQMIPDQILDNVLLNHYLSLRETVNGWTAWACSQGTANSCPGPCVCFRTTGD